MSILITERFLEKFENEELTRLQGMIRDILRDRKTEYPVRVRASELSPRSMNVLIAADIVYWWQIEDIEESDLKSRRNCGYHTLKAIRVEMNKRNLKYKNER